MSKRKIAVVAGASAGAGRTTVRTFAQNGGFDVALLPGGAASLSGAPADVEAAGVRPLILPTDVRDFEEVDCAASQFESALGPHRVRVNDAMTTVFAPSWGITPADFARGDVVTFLGQVWA
jgi:NAD(P)-dependent dehydrogenase (short-subunit alcohol dehydrogenase family)